MKISDMISDLQRIKEDNGDMNVVINDSEDVVGFEIDRYNNTVEVY